MEDKLDSLNQPQKEGTTLREISFTGERIQKAFRSRLFNRELKTLTARYHADVENFEGGFVFFELIKRRAPYSVLPFDNVTDGSVDFGPDTTKKNIEKLKQGHFPLVSVHLHPHQLIDSYHRADYLPSQTDLVALKENRDECREISGFDGKPISIIAMPISRKKVRLHLLQEGEFAPQSNETIVDCEDALTRCRNEAEIMEALEQYGYNTAILNYDLMAGFTQKELDKLDQFAFTMKEVEKDDYLDLI